MREFPKTSLQVIHIDEPQLQFGYDQVLDHPKDGLFLYGPHQIPKRRTISVGLIATEHGEKLFRNWLYQVLKGVKVPKPSKHEKIFRPHLSDFPGLEETYGISVNTNDLTVYRLQQTEIENLTTLENHYEAVSRTVDLFLTPIKDHLSDEEKTIDVWVFVVPGFVFERCRPLASGRRNIELTPGEFARKQKSKSDLPLFTNIIDLGNEQIFDDVPDFHRQVKAKMLELAQPCQLIRETTLAPKEFLNKAGNPLRRVQDPATVSWNVATALFYKSQEFPPWEDRRNA